MKEAFMKKRKLCSLFLVTALVLSGCGVKVVDHASDVETTASVKESIVESDTAVPVKNGATLSVLDIKHKYASAGGDMYLSPFYNVAQDTVFQFHFDTMVEPCYAITVHTDPKCDVNSTVYQINDGYTSGSGVDVVVKPGLGVLQCDERAGNVSGNYKWGNASIYYLAIHNDFKTGEHLDEPVVVPFTVKSDVSVPTVSANIDMDGMFYLTWNPVKDAVQYNIYSSYYRSDNVDAAQHSRAEMGFVGDHPTKIATVEDTEFRGFKDGADNFSLDNDGVHVYSQNDFAYDNYFVTAVDAQGHESFFSFPVSGWLYNSQLPKSFDSYKGFGTKASDGTVERLPDTVQVMMADKSMRVYPVNYTKKMEEYGYAIYGYQIVGTKMTGEVKLKNATADYPASKESGALMDYAVYKIDNQITIVPANDVDTIKGIEPNLSGGVALDASLKLPVSQDALLLRADLENARMVTDGAYTTNPQDAIPTYLSDRIPPVESQEAEPETQAETTAVDESLPEEPVVTTPQDDIVTMNEEVTEQEVQEADKIEVQNTGYPIFADSAEEEYLAQCMIASQTDIDLTAFPRLKDASYLCDVVFKVIRQNPYIISPEGIQQTDPSVLNVTYSYDAATNASKQAELDAAANEIVSSTITSDMSAEDKVMALWSYLEDNTQYDNAACEAAIANEFTDMGDYADSFNAFGILCNKVGVCQSYSYAFHILADKAGLDVLTLTGVLNGNLPHAWNVVNLDGGWYWVDTTNNETTSGIPYLLYQTSFDTAKTTGYTLDDESLLDKDFGQVYTTDNQKDWWYQNNLVARSTGEISTIFGNIYSNAEKGTWVGVKLACPVTEEDAIVAAVAGIAPTGAVTQEEMASKGYVFAMNYLFIER